MQVVNAGTALQTHWRWNGRPVRVTVEPLADGGGWRISWLRWFPRTGAWRTWQSYVGTGQLASVVRRYRDYAAEWRGMGDR